MSATVEAVYEDGVFRPTERPPLAEGAHVRLIVEPVTARSVDEVLRLAAKVYEGLSANEVDEVERMTRRRPLFEESPSR